MSDGVTRRRGFEFFSAPPREPMKRAGSQACPDCHSCLMPKLTTLARHVGGTRPVLQPLPNLLRLRKVLFLGGAGLVESGLDLFRLRGGALRPVPSVARI